MARIRSTHPGQWTSGDFLECSPLARLLALALRNGADDNGIFRWKPMTLKAECLPADNCDILQLLEELVRNDQITKYSVGGKEYGIIKDFTQWQRPKKPKYIHPVPDGFSTSSEPVEDQSHTEPENPPQRKEEGGKRKEVEKKDLETAAKERPRANEAFERFKAAYPRRDGANPWQPAEKKFNALVKSGVDPEIMIKAALELAREEGARGNIGTKFIPQALTWLNQQRFTDYAAAAFTALTSSKYYAKADSEQLEAWDAHARATAGKSLPRDAKGGWHVDTEWPPGYVPPERTHEIPPLVLRSMQ